MAFQAPTRAHQPQLPLGHQVIPLENDANRQSSIDHSLLTPATEEWVVFSPSTAEDTNTILSGLSQDNDGSIVTASSPHIARHNVIPGGFDENYDDDEEDEESLDGAETDSLQAFRDHDGPVMLPTHDGLGTFQSTTASGVTGFRSLEESLRVVAASSGGKNEDDTHARIQRWRIEQGQALMEEIEKATRRRRLSIIGQRGDGHDGKLKEDDEAASMGSISDAGVAFARASTSSALKTVTEAGDLDETVNESFWARITRSFIRDIIGIDDHLLEVIFGEALPTEARIDSSTEGRRINKEEEERILKGIAKELGGLVDLYTYHPSGAFSTRRNLFDDEEQDGAKTPQPWSNQPELRPMSSRVVSFVSDNSSMPIRFTPTLQTAHHQEEASHAALWGIEEESSISKMRKDYWEQDLDIHLVFSYLKSRFLGRARTSASPSTTSSSTPPLHHHHPLINRNGHSLYRRPSSSGSKVLSPAATHPGNSYLGPTVGVGITRAASSCASQERVTKERRGSRTSSRGRGYYWDIATSVGSGQTGSCGGTGAWAAI